MADYKQYLSDKVGYLNRGIDDKFGDDILNKYKKPKPLPWEKSMPSKDSLSLISERAYYPVQKGSPLHHRPNLPSYPYLKNDAISKIFPAEQSSDIPWGNPDFKVFRDTVVRLAKKEYLLWNSKGSKLKEFDSEPRLEKMYQYWKTTPAKVKIVGMKDEISDSYLPASDSAKGSGPYKNWGASFIAYIYKQAGGNTTTFTFKNLDNIRRAIFNKYWFLEQIKLRNLYSELLRDPFAGIPPNNNNMSQFLVGNLLQQARSPSYPLMFFDQDIKSGLVLCEPGDILCYVNSKAEKDVWMKKFSGKIPGNLNMHVDLDIIIYSAFNKKTNQVIIRTIGHKNNSVTTKLFCFDIVKKTDPATGQPIDQYDLKDELLFGIMKFPSTAYKFIYPTI